MGVVTKGRGDTDQWVKSYKAESILIEGQPFVPVDNGRTFTANTDRDTAVTNFFTNPIQVAASV